MAACDMSFLVAKVRGVKGGREGIMVECRNGLHDRIVRTVSCMPRRMAPEFAHLIGRNVTLVVVIVDVVVIGMRDG